MGDKKHIDRIFQERLKDFEVFPDAEVWKNIEEQLVKKKKRRVFPLWLRLGSAAAILLMLISTSFWYYNSVKATPKLPDSNAIITDVDTDVQQNVLEKNEQYPSNEEEQTSIDKTSVIPIQKGTLQLKSKKATRFANASSNQQEGKAAIKSQIPTVAKEESIANAEIKKDAVFANESTNAIAQTSTLENTNIAKENAESIAKTTTIVASNTTTKKVLKNDNKKDINETLKEENESLVLEKNDANKNNWSVGSTVAPIYYNTLGKGSPIHSALTENEKSSITSISYGIKVNYKVNDKLSLQSGINSLDLAYQTKNVSTLITSKNGLSNDTNINTNVEGIEIVAVSNNDNSRAQSQELATSGLNNKLSSLTGNLNQSFSYIEVPMEAKYTVFQKKFGVNVIGGLSTYVLYNKGVTLQTENGSTTLGEASNINDVNFSGNVGLDLDYNISKKLYINVSPMFKYQFNTFSKNDGGFKPYYIGVYTGLNFRF